jgi:hypothetical protein
LTFNNQGEHEINGPPLTGCRGSGDFTVWKIFCGR